MNRHRSNIKSEQVVQRRNFPSILVQIPISRMEVEKCNIHPFLELAGTFLDSEGCPFPHLQGSVMISFSGYDDDPREIYEIPEIRKYCRTLHAEWSRFTFFHELESCTLAVLIACCLSNLVGARKAGAAHSRFGLFTHEVGEFLLSEFDTFFALAEQAGFSTEKALARWETVQQYLETRFFSSK